jgi:tryptophanyl-tRNA synthetase
MEKYLLAFKVQEHLILNLLGAIIPAIKLSNKPENESFLFIADLHSITQIKTEQRYELQYSCSMARLRIRYQ